MSSILLPPLPQLRLELEICATLDAHLSVLLTLRRTLVRHYHAVPYANQQAAPVALRRQFYACLTALTAPAPFPAPS